MNLPLPISIVLTLAGLVELAIKLFVFLLVGVASIGLWWIIVCADCEYRLFDYFTPKAWRLVYE